MNPLLGMRKGRFSPTMNSAYQLRTKGTHMTAAVLKRKLRNFPTAKLGQRLATA
jgi:hypothetical protein